MSIFKAAENRAEYMKNQPSYEKMMEKYKGLETPEEKIKYLLGLKENINDNSTILNFKLALAFKTNMGKSYGDWIKGEIALQKEKIEARKYFNNEAQNSKNTKQDGRIKHPGEEKKTKKYWNKNGEKLKNRITGKDNSVNAHGIAKHIKEELNLNASLTTIKDWIGFH